MRSARSPAPYYETPDHLLPDNIQGHGAIDFPIKPHWAANLGNGPSATKWGNHKGTNQGVKHFAQYYDDFPDRIPSIEKRLGLELGKLGKHPEGFDTFTEAALKVSKHGETRIMPDGKMFRFLAGVDGPKKGITVVTRDNLLQSMIASDYKTFMRMN